MDMNKFLMQIVRLNDMELILVLEKLVEIKTVDENILRLHTHDVSLNLVDINPVDIKKEIDDTTNKIETVRAELLRRM